MKDFTIKVRIVFGLFIVLISCSGHKQTPNAELQAKTGSDLVQSGLQIEYGPNLGASHVDPLGNRHFYVHYTATITNDSTVPIELHLALGEEYEFPAFCGDSIYRVFLLPEELTPDTATIYNSIVNGQHDYLNTPLRKPFTLNKVLASGDFCVVTIGVLIRTPANCAAVPRATFSSDTKALYEPCNRLINKDISVDPQFELGVKLEYYYKRKFIPPDDGCAVIPFGHISYPEY